MKRIPWIFTLGFAALVFLANGAGLFQRQELGFLDLRFQARGRQPVHSDIVIIEIDDASINQMGHWPWPRSFHAALLNVLKQYRPRSVFFDVLFTEASLSPQDDQLLAFSVKDLGNVILAFFYQTEKPFTAFFPIPSLRQAAKRLGYVNIHPDSDARVRRIHKSLDSGKEIHYHTSVAAVQENLPASTDKKAWVDRIPADPHGSFLINFPGPYSVFRRISFHEVIAGHGTRDAELQGLFENKIVIIGHTATGGGDFRPTPFSSAYPGVGIQAASVHTLLTGKFLREVGPWVSFLILLALTCTVTFASRHKTLKKGLIAIPGLAFFYLAANFLLFNFFGWILPVFPALLVIFGVYILILFIQFIQVRFEGELMSCELSLAAQIQETLLPKEGPSLEGIDMGFHCKFAREVGGDLYDWVLLDEKKLGICVGDVSGKGVPAALYMARTLTEERSLAKDSDSPARFLSVLNNRLVAAGISRMFITLLDVVLDLETRTLKYSNGGHEPLYYFDSRKKEGRWLKGAAAQPLGLFSDIDYPEERITVEAGDWVLLISDGVRELRNPRREEWGLEGVAKALNSCPGNLSAGETVQRLFKAMDEHSRGEHAHDDRTVLCMKIGGLK